MYLVKIGLTIAHDFGRISAMPAMPSANAALLVAPEVTCPTPSLSASMRLPRIVNAGAEFSEARARQIGTLLIAYAKSNRIRFHTTHGLPAKSPRMAFSNLRLRRRLHLAQPAGRDCQDYSDANEAR